MAAVEFRDALQHSEANIEALRRAAEQGEGGDNQHMDEQVYCRKVTVTGSQGLHARPADLFVKLANRYESKIEVIKDGERVDGKSILAILTLAAVQGTELTIEAQGPDAEAAVNALVLLVENNFESES